MTITEFLEARIAEDEAAALPFRNELGDTKEWRSDEVGGAVRYVGRMEFGLTDLLAKFDTHLEAAHIARHDPTRVLAECKAKRAVIAHFMHLSEDKEAYWAYRDYAGHGLEIMAAAYKDHADYQQEWALDG